MLNKLMNLTVGIVLGATLLSGCGDADVDRQKLKGEWRSSDQGEKIGLNIGENDLAIAESPDKKIVYTISGKTIVLNLDEAKTRGINDIEIKGFDVIELTDNKLKIAYVENGKTIEREFSRVEAAAVPAPVEKAPEAPAPVEQAPEAPAQAEPAPEVPASPAPTEPVVQPVLEAAPEAPAAEIAPEAPTQP